MSWQAAKKIISGSINEKAAEKRKLCVKKRRK